MLLENNQTSRITKSKEKSPKKLPKQKSNKVLNIGDRANIMKIIPTLPRASLPRFHETALQDVTGQCNREKPFRET